MQRYLCLPHARIERGPYAITAVQPEHIESIRRWRNEQIDILRQTAPITAEQQELYYATHIWPSMNEARPPDLLLSYLRENCLIGYGGLVHIAWEHARAEVSFLLDPEQADGGAGYRVHYLNFMALIKDMAFADLRFHRLWTETYAFRAQQIALLLESGFSLEGVLREHVRIGGRAVDSVVHGCLRTDAGYRHEHTVLR